MRKSRPPHRPWLGRYRPFDFDEKSPGVIRNGDGEISLPLGSVLSPEHIAKLAMSTNSVAVFIVV